MGKKLPIVNRIMGNFVDIGQRLREERERLGMNQSAFAEHAAVTRKTLFGYESGDRAPDAAALAAWAALGLDVLYVVTGTRTGAASAAPELKPEHAELISDYDQSSPGDKAAIRQLAKSVAKTTGTADATTTRRRAAGGRK